MKKRFLTLLLLFSMIATLLVGCGSSEFSNALTAQEFLSYGYADEDGNILYVEDIPEEKWNVDEEGQKYLAVTVDSEQIKGFHFYENGNTNTFYANGNNSESSISTASSITDTYFYNMQNWISFITNWGKDTEGLNSANEKVLTIEEFNSLYNTIDITKENVNDYFSLSTIEYEDELTGSNFEDEHFYYPEKAIKLSCTADNIVTNKNIEVLIKTDYSRSDVSYSIARDNYEDKSNEYTYGPYSDSTEWTLYSHSLNSDEHYYYSLPLVSAYLSDDKIHITEYTYDSYEISKVQGNIITFTEPEDTMWNISPSGISYLAVRVDEDNIVRLTNTGLTISYVYNGLEASFEEALSYYIESHEEENLNPSDYWNYWSMYYFE